MQKPVTTTYRLQDESAGPTIRLDELAEEMSQHLLSRAGIDRYMSSVLMGRTTKTWRGHAASSPVLRHSNSSGLYVTIEGAPAEETPAPAPEIDVPPATPAKPTSAAVKETPAPVVVVATDPTPIALDDSTTVVLTIPIETAPPADSGTDAESPGQE